jgi:hypothetical protein
MIGTLIPPLTGHESVLGIFRTVHPISKPCQLLGC